MFTGTSGEQVVLLAGSSGAGLPTGDIKVVTLAIDFASAPAIYASKGALFEEFVMMPRSDGRKFENPSSPLGYD